MRVVKPSGDFLVKVATDGHEAMAKVSDFAKGAGLAQLATDAAGGLSAGGAIYGASMFGVAAGDYSDQSAKIQSAIDKIAARGRGGVDSARGRYLHRRANLFAQQGFADGWRKGGNAHSPYWRF